jgi:cell division protein FtsB
MAETASTENVVRLGAYKGKTVDQAMVDEMQRIDGQPNQLMQRMREDARTYVRELESKRKEIIARFNIAHDIAVSYNKEHSAKIMGSIATIQDQIAQLNQQVDALTESLQAEHKAHANRSDLLHTDHLRNLAEIDQMIAAQETMIAGLAKQVN